MPMLGAFSCRLSVSPEPSAARMPLLILRLSLTGYCYRERQNSLFVLEFTSTVGVYGFSSTICAASSLVYDVLFLCLFICIFHAYSYDTYILVVRCMKQNMDAVWSLVLLLVTGVRADPKYSYSHDTLCMYVRIVTFDFSLKYFTFLVCTWQSE